LGAPSAEIEAMATLNSDRWEMATGWSPRTNASRYGLANPNLVSIRLAWSTLQKSKREPIAVADELGDQALMGLASQIDQSADWFRGLHKVLECPETRIMCADATLNDR
jgi:hypothetical protein